MCNRHRSFVSISNYSLQEVDTQAEGTFFSYRHFLFTLLSPPAEGAAGHTAVRDDLHAPGDILAARAAVACLRLFFKLLAADGAERDVRFEV